MNHGYNAMGAFTVVSLAEAPQLAFIFVSWSGDQIQDFCAYQASILQPRYTLDPKLPHEVICRNLMWRVVKWQRG